MFKTALASALLAASAVSFTLPAHAAAHAKACDDDTVAMVMEQVQNAPDAKKEMAMQEFAMAQEKMEAGMAEDCSGHLTKASELSAN